jgi:hypothetical protein
MDAANIRAFLGPDDYYDALGTKPDLTKLSRDPFRTKAA